MALGNVHVGKGRNSDEVRPFRWFAPSLIEEDSYLLLDLGSEGPSWLASQVRTVERIALMGRDHQETFRAALQTISPTVKDMLCLGTRLCL